MTIYGWAFALSSAETREGLGSDVEWFPLEEPMTVAAGLRAHGKWSLKDKRNFDEETWWYRARVIVAKPSALCFGGLATLADVYVDDKHVLRSENMFHAHRVELAPGEHDVRIRFSPVATALGAKRPRPRWKTRITSNQQMRWIRTSLLGRMPGWSPPVAPVGPWRPITIEEEKKPVFSARLDGADGIVTLEGAHLRVGSHEGKDTVRIPNVELWWPHTHGTPARHAVKARIGDREWDLGHVAFRSVALDTSDGGFALSINGAPVFCRGASWTTADAVTLAGNYRTILERVRDAGMNMLRLSGTLYYESDAFYEICDELGIMVWQDFMFANMDYPIADEGFRASVVREAEQTLERLANRACLTVLCGGSEVEQQAAMFGAPRENWQGPLFAEILPEISSRLAPGIPYWPNSPSGGAMPFHVDEGVGHYYGVGAYLRGFDDARRARVRFAAECLAFSNPPEEDLFKEFLGDTDAPFVNQKWKERTSKDNGAGWDFEDVRDHYVKLLFGVDPMRVRYQDMERYLALSRLTVGEVMARVFAEFRSHRSPTRGALVWFLQDLWPGAGWGVLDSRGIPKSPYWFLKRVLQPRAIFITDEGVNGLTLHVVNDAQGALEGTLRFALHRDGEVVTVSGERAVSVPARGTIAIKVDAILPSFVDSARAYGFGPPGHDLAVASIEGVAETTYLFDFAHPPACHAIEASLDRDGEDLIATLSSKRFAHAVKISIKGYLPDDDYFDLAPGVTKKLRLRPLGAPPKYFSGSVAAANLATPVQLALKPA